MAVNKLQTPLGYKTKSERRHYEKQAKRLERFLVKLFRSIDRRLSNGSISTHKEDQDVK